VAGRTWRPGRHRADFRRSPDDLRRALRPSETAKKQLNHAGFVRITLRDGHIDRWEFHAPFDALFDTTRLEYGSKVDLRGRYSNYADQRERVQRAIAIMLPPT
jgi:hypothetical protein